MIPRTIKVKDLDPGHRFLLAGQEREIYDIEHDLFGERSARIRFGQTDGNGTEYETLIMKTESDFDILLNKE